MDNNQNFLFSTTRQWNPGDEIILHGLINILKSNGYLFNPIIFNRNPDIRPNYIDFNPFVKLNFDNKSINNLINSFFRLSFLDNSVSPSFDYANIDKLFIAGSPEWYSLRMRELYNKAIKHKIPVEFHGLGLSHDKKRIPKFAVKLLERSILTTVRDEKTYDLLSCYENVKLITCPSIFCSSPKITSNSIKHIGLIYVDKKSPIGNSIDKSIYIKLIKFYQELIKHFNHKVRISFICHYVTEINECRAVFPDSNIYYHYDSFSYLDIYKNFDFVIGPRLHGIAASVSQGIPSILISHDLRSSAGKHFGIDVLNLTDDITEMIIERINDYKYINLIRKRIKSNYLLNKKEYSKLLNKND